MGLDVAVLRLGQLKSLQHGELVLVAGLALLVLRGGCASDHQVFSAEGLKFDSIGTRAPGRIAEQQRHCKVTVVVDAGLGDQENRWHRTTHHHAVHPPSTTRL